MGRISDDDKCLIKSLRIEKRWGRKKLMTEFPNKGWSKGGLDHLIAKIDATAGLQEIRQW